MAGVGQLVHSPTLLTSEQLQVQQNCSLAVLMSCNAAAVWCAQVSVALGCAWQAACSRSLCNVNGAPVSSGRRCKQRQEASQESNRSAQQKVALSLGFALLWFYFLLALVAYRESSKIRFVCQIFNSIFDRIRI